jgi:phosphopantetheinyl transferase
MLYLTEAKIQRREKYHFNKDSNRFIFSRGLLKFILPQHTNPNISEIRIEKDE